MSVESRLDHLERSMGPVAALVRWSQEAHAFGSLGAYHEHQDTLPDEARAEVQIASQVQSSAARSIGSGRSAEAIAAGLRAARDALFRYRLALKIEIDISSILATFVRVRDDLGADRKALIAYREWPRPAETGASSDLFDWLDATEAAYASRVIDFVRDAFALVELHTTLERRYFDGHSMLFPETLSAERELLAALPVMIDAADQITRGRQLAADSGRESLAPGGVRLAALEAEGRGRAPDLALRLVNVVRINTLLGLGEFEKAYALDRILEASGQGPALRFARPSIRYSPTSRRGR
jgi:hypothetical protein